MTMPAACYVSFKVEGRNFTYRQPGWWCSLTDPDDMEGQLVDEDNQIADMALYATRPRAQPHLHG
jgi:hypothetical protein